MPFYRCKCQAPNQQGTTYAASSNSTIHLYYDHNDNDDAEYYRPVVGGSVSASVGDAKTATVSAYSGSLTYGTYIRQGSPSYTLRGVRRSDGATVTIGSGSGNWAATTYNVEAYSSLTLSISSGQASRYRWPPGTSYDIWCVWSITVYLTLNAPPLTVNDYFTYAGTYMGSGS